MLAHYLRLGRRKGYVAGNMGKQLGVHRRKWLLPAGKLHRPTH
jgi:hypothetical protein